MAYERGSGGGGIQIIHSLASTPPQSTAHALCVVEERQVNLCRLVSLARRHGEVVSRKASPGTDRVCGGGGLVFRQ
ncbi:hypothetical protein E2C01_058744 [Portunus trituberculatus]|uniref:Uncharacterized protein n=1 Tax=Portunus trituberculatus TaxID=210409 RepID=A0A5B7H414_PORTR|nr:hypothetical protein [Portunus trituberculatus]